MRLIYDPGYDIRFFGLERLHPFDARKYSRAYERLRGSLGEAAIAPLRLSPAGPITDDELLRVHCPEYLASLRRSSTLAAALEMPFLRFLPRALIERCVLRPMRRAVAGTILAAEAALEHGLAANLSGGYHHAKPDAGEGFCLFADAALAAEALRRKGALPAEAALLSIDCDAHQGNGLCAAFAADPKAFLFDMYNADVYPDEPALRRGLAADIPLRSGCRDERYLGLLRSRLPAFLDEAAAAGPIGIAFYNAGSDILAGDPLGGLGVSEDGVLARDAFVIEALRRRSIPTVFLPSGGYTSRSSVLLAEAIAAMIRVYA